MRKKSMKRILCWLLAIALVSGHPSFQTRSRKWKERS